MLKITSKLLKAEAESRGWRVEVIDEAGSLLRYTLPNGKQFIGYGMTSRLTPYLGVKIVDNKGLTFKLLAKSDVPLPKTTEITDAQGAIDLLKEFESIVVKPLDAAHGNGVTTDVTTAAQAMTAFETALKFSKRVIAQQQVFGDDWRLLFIGGELAAASIRQPASVTGDGQHTIAELIEAENTSGERAANYELPKNFIDAAAAKRFLGDELSSVPKSGEQVQVVGTANIGSGGISIDKTAAVTPAMLKASKTIVEVVGLETCAVDVIVKDNEFWLIEVNANPSLGLHIYPAVGEPRPVDKIYLDWVEAKL